VQAAHGPRPAQLRSEARAQRAVRVARHLEQEVEIDGGARRPLTRARDVRRRRVEDGFGQREDARQMGAHPPALGERHGRGPLTRVALRRPGEIAEVEEAEVGEVVRGGVCREVQQRGRPRQRRHGGAVEGQRAHVFPQRALVRGQAVGGDSPVQVDAQQPTTRWRGPIVRGEVAVGEPARQSLRDRALRGAQLAARDQPDAEALERRFGARHVGGRTTTSMSENRRRSGAP
jgi:hypothetical protein